jgi:hypothetical protein
MGLMIRRKPKLWQTNLPQYHSITNRTRNTSGMNPGHQVAEQVTGCLAAFAIKRPIGQLYSSLVFLPQYQAKALSSGTTSK